MAVDYEAPLLTLKEVRDWQHDKEKVDAQIASLQKRSAELAKRLEAAAMFIPPSPPQAVQGLFKRINNGNGRDDTPSLPSFTGAIVEILRESDKTLSRAQLRKALATRGYPKKQLSNYMYTALSRLRDQGRITRSRNRYAVPAEETPELQSHGAPSNG